MRRPWFASYEADVPERLTYPDVPLHSFLADAAGRRPDHPALLFYGRPLTYRQLDEQANQFAHFLRSLGLRKGDRVAIMLPNVPQCVIAYYGVLRAGGVVVMTNPLYVEREIQIQMSDAGAETIVTLDFLYPKVAKIKDETPLKHFILTSVQDELPWLLSLFYPLKARKEGQWVHVEKAPPIYDLLPALRDFPDSPPGVLVAPDDLALLQYTGGTTGTPKGVMLSHRNLVANTLQCRHWMPTLREGAEVFLSVVPFFHVYGMSTCMNLSIRICGTLVLLPRFVTRDLLQTIEKTKATIFMGVQAMYVAVNNFPKIKDYDLSSITVCISGAGPLHQEVQKKFEALTGGKLVEGYGLSETSPVTHCNPISGKRKGGSIGLPVADTEAKIVDPDTGAELPLGEVGEIAVAGPQVMSGYWKREAETAAVLRDGWFYTGDMARMDEDGFFFIVDRKKDMIKSRGENVYPREVEEVLFRHPKVQDAVVVGLPDPLLGERIKAYVVLKEGMSATEAEIIQFCRGELSHFKVPQPIEFRASLPKTIIGKVLRRVLQEEERQKAAANLPS